MVPFYQRSYVWTRADQWEQLWEDIRAKADARLVGGRTTPHFLGAVVLDPQPRVGLIGVDTLHIIDGQQRLATLQFILKSVLLVLKLVNSTTISEIVSGTLKNSNPDTMCDPAIEVFKVWPTFRDRHDYRSALEANNRDALKTIFPKSFTQRETMRKIGVRHPHPLEAIWFFNECFENWIKEGTDEKVAVRAEILATAILQDLKVVSIVLDEDDDAQVIFETLNGRGAQLHATDLIRNFIFMRADREGLDSEELYNTFWLKFEHSYWNEEQRRGRLRKPRIEWFIHACLQAEFREEVDLGRLYFEYRHYVFNDNEPKSAQIQLTILSKYAGLYQELVDGIGDSPMANFGRRIAPYDITTLHPLALLIGVSPLTDEAKNEMFSILISYIVRRLICGLTPKNYNNIFISILRNLSKSEMSPDALRKLLSSLKGDASRWPEDEEFKSICQTASIYPGKLEAPKMRAILAELELELRQTARTEDSFSIDLSHLDVDHILPRSWYKHWPLPNGSEVEWSETRNIRLKQFVEMPLDEREQAIISREDSIPTLGNLTLLNLSVNREAQHKSFSLKKELLLENTTLRLNVPLLGMETWNEETIKKRGEILSDVALRVWPGIKAESGKGGFLTHPPHKAGQPIS
jgi:hypothetical protein